MPPLPSPAWRLLRETITAIDAEAKRVTTDKGVHHARHPRHRPWRGLRCQFHPRRVLGVNEFYSVPGAAHCPWSCPGSRAAKWWFGVCGAPYKCPPAPSECA